MKPYDTRMHAPVTDIAVIGAGITGISVAHSLAESGEPLEIMLIDPRAPMSYTSAHSGENYRTWWPHPMMRSFMIDSLKRLEDTWCRSGGAFRMTRRGYALATRECDVEAVLSRVFAGYHHGQTEMRLHTLKNATKFSPPSSPNWRDAPGSVDVLSGSDFVRQHFPSFDRKIETIVLLRQAGEFDSQQLSQWMLQTLKAAGGMRVQAAVTAIDQNRDGFILSLDGGAQSVQARQIVNAAGPHVAEITAMLGEDLPVSNIFQQKLAFDDVSKVLPRTMPFSLDIDPIHLDWDSEERRLLAEDPETEWLVNELAGFAHCRPEGGDNGSWVKLGWALNRSPAPVTDPPPLDSDFQDILLRATARLNPGLKTYYGKLPRARTLYGGYYTMTEENWPLIGPMKTSRAFIAGAMSGFGTMAACQTGSLIADWILERPLPAYASALSPERYKNRALMTDLQSVHDRGIL